MAGHAKSSASLKRKGIALEDLNYLFVTHYHPDHAGIVQELKDRGIQHVVFEQQRSAIPRLKTYMKRDSGYIGFIAGPNVSVESSLGDNGQRLHDRHVRRGSTRA